MCTCQRQCYSTEFQNVRETVLAGVKPHRGRDRLFYQAKSYEEITEELAYELIPLLCGIGKFKASPF